MQNLCFPNGRRHKVERRRPARLLLEKNFCQPSICHHLALSLLRDLMILTKKTVHIARGKEHRSRPASIRTDKTWFLPWMQRDERHTRQSPGTTGAARLRTVSQTGARA